MHAWRVSLELGRAALKRSIVFKSKAGKCEIHLWKKKSCNKPHLMRRLEASAVFECTINVSVSESKTWFPVGHSHPHHLLMSRLSFCSPALLISELVLSSACSNVFNHFQGITRGPQQAEQRNCISFSAFSTFVQTGGKQNKTLESHFSESLDSCKRHPGVVPPAARSWKFDGISALCDLTPALCDLTPRTSLWANNFSISCTRMNFPPFLGV